MQLVRTLLRQVESVQRKEVEGQEAQFTSYLSSQKEQEQSMFREGKEVLKFQMIYLKAKALSIMEEEGLEESLLAT